MQICCVSLLFSEPCLRNKAKHPKTFIALIRAPPIESQYLAVACAWHSLSIFIDRELIYYAILANAYLQASEYNQIMVCKMEEAHL